MKDRTYCENSLGFENAKTFKIVISKSNPDSCIPTGDEMRSQDGNSTRKWERHKKGGELYVGKEKRVDESGFDPCAAHYPRFLAGRYASPLIFLEAVVVNFLHARDLSKAHVSGAVSVLIFQPRIEQRNRSPAAG